MTTTDTLLSAALDDAARGLDRVAGALCSVTPAERERVLLRLKRLAADAEVIAQHLERESRQQRDEPARPH